MVLSAMSPGGIFLLSRLVGTEELEDCHGPSIFSRLKHFDPMNESSLDPCPDLNGILSELVSYLQGSFSSSTFQGQQYSTVESEVCTWIDSSDAYLSRAAFIRCIATTAEARLERYYAMKVLSSTIELKPSMSGVEKLVAASAGFPYVQNYVDMIKKESKVVLSFLERECANVENLIQNSRATSAEDIILAFCGSGPIPFSGILFTLNLNCKIVLIDNDKEAAELSRKLLRLYEEWGVIPSGKVRVICANCQDLTYEKAARVKPSGKNLDSVVKCDVLFVAALIPDEHKVNMFQRLNRQGENSPLVILRTAHGLTARLAYKVAQRQHLTQYMQLRGVVAPTTHKLENGHVVGDSVKPVDFFSSEILNSLEIYTASDSCTNEGATIDASIETNGEKEAGYTNGECKSSSTDLESDEFDIEG